MKKIIRLTEKDLTRIVRKTIKENQKNIDEGFWSTLKGLGGLVKGTGYRYTKYAYEISNTVKELNENIVFGRKELDKILRTIEQTMDGDEKQEILIKYIEDSLNSYDNIISNNEKIIKELNESIGDTSHEINQAYS